MTKQIQPLKVPATMDGVKLDRFLLRAFPAMPKPLFYKLCRTGEIRINSHRAKGAERLAGGDQVRVPPVLSDMKKIELQRTEDGSKFDLADLEVLRRAIIYNDDSLVAFNKPAGLAVQGGTNVKKSMDKMVSALFPDAEMLPVHRLDRETSGVIIFAKNLAAARNLSEQLHDKTAEKEYLAILAGDVKNKSGRIETYVAKTGSDSDPKLAITEYEVLGAVPGQMTLVRFRPKTGRTHQLRIHSSKELKAAIFGDGLYGFKKDAEKYAFGKCPKELHLLARKLSISHPLTGERLELQAKVPEFMMPAVQNLGGVND
ncbi:MAG: RluA family pseudouridine synthase [Rickettsiales bacterium]|nr:RluA family pseudouridine synthase [Rickettsiales bacterium]